jgi:hypothetical protein
LCVLVCNAFLGYQIKKMMMLNLLYLVVIGIMATALIHSAVLFVVRTFYPPRRQDSCEFKIIDVQLEQAPAPQNVVELPRKSDPAPDGGTEDLRAAPAGSRAQDTVVAEPGADDSEAAD